VSALLDAALGYAARGWPVFPCKPGRKEPATAHGVLDATTDEGQIRAWWAAMPDANVAIATGAPGPDVVDVDVKPEGSGYDALSQIAAARLADGFAGTVTTPSGGMHLYFAGTGQRNGSVRRAHIDFRGAGGYVLAPPGTVAGRPYTSHSGIGQTGAAVDWPAVRALLDPPPDPQPFRQPARDSGPAGDRPGDDWAARTSWPDILQPHGWVLTRQLGNGVAMWRRPGKRDGSSATTRENGGLYVFSTSTEFEAEVPYSKFGALAVLQHGGDHATAAAALRAAGYGTQAPAPVITPAQFQQPASGQQDAAQDDGQPPRSSWHPRDLTAILDGDGSGDPPPAFLSRSDGAMLFYAGKVNALIGESESGKTWIALAAVVQALHAGQHVVYLDFEDAPAGIVGRLVSLGATRAQIEKLFRYISPDEPLTQQGVYDLAQVLADPAPELAIVDGVNAAMTLLGLNLKDNKDVTDFSMRLLRPLKRTGAAVVTVDHVTKDKESRGLSAIGAQAKRADIDGAAYIVDAVKKFGRGQPGKLRMTVSKDRPGHVRAVSADATYAGMAILTPHDDGTITIEIKEPGWRTKDERPEFRPTHLMEAVSVFAESQDGPVTAGAIKAAVRGKAEWITEAIRLLAASGHLAAEDGPRGARLHRSVAPYREESEDAARPVPTRSRPVPTRSRNGSSDAPDDPFPPVPEGGTEYPSGNGNGSGSREGRNGAGNTPHVPDHGSLHRCGVCAAAGGHEPDCPVSSP
jgi:KaiC/GvpD/RAD55 family RecA-like ATPase